MEGRMSEKNEIDQLAEYEKLLEQQYPDLPDNWDSYEEMRSIKQAFAEGKTAKQIIGRFHWLYEEDAPRYKCDGSEFGD